VDDGAVLEFDRDCLVGAFHKESVMWLASHRSLRRESLVAARRSRATVRKLRVQLTGRASCCRFATALGRSNEAEDFSRTRESQLLRIVNNSLGHANVLAYVVEEIAVSCSQACLTIKVNLKLRLPAKITTPPALARAL
jgi:hypothetical protein